MKVVFLQLCYLLMAIFFDAYSITNITFFQFINKSFTIDFFFQLFDSEDPFCMVSVVTMSIAETLFQRGLPAGYRNAGGRYRISIHRP